MREQIENYIPVNDQEMKDKEMILKYIDTFKDVLTRENEIVHFTCSAFILNEKGDKTLMVYHNIYKSWSWVGGHADGDSNFLNVVAKEVKEETGVKNVKFLSNEIFSLDVLSVKGHRKRGNYVTPHIHISVAYLVEVNEEELLHIKEDENSNVGWLPLQNFLDSVSEEHMKPIYIKMCDKAKKMGFIR